MQHNINNDDILRIVAPLNPILEDEKVWEIMIDSFDQVLVEREGRLEQIASPFASAEALQSFIDDLFGLYGITLNAENPVGYLQLPDHSRLMAVVAPNAVNGPHVVCRRIIGHNLSWEQLIDWGCIPEKGVALLRSAVESRVNILISGGSGAGKTTIANLMAEMCPPEERLIVVEQVYEMEVNHPRILRLEAGGPAQLPMEDVLTAASRMRPDRLIVGNITGPFAATVLQYFGTGYDGGMTHIHATSVNDALYRLESFCLMANLGFGLTEIRQLIAAGIGLVLYQEHLSDGSRKMVEITEVKGTENHRYLLQPLMRYNRESGLSEFTGVTPGWEA